VTATGATRRDERQEILEPRTTDRLKPRTTDTVVHGSSIGCRSQSRIAESKNTNLLNIFVAKKHEDSHVEISTISTGLSFLIVTTITKTTTKTRTTIFISS